MRLNIDIKITITTLQQFTCLESTITAEMLDS